MAMVGDAISHSILPGIVIAYLITGSRGTLASVIGAVTFGVLTTILIEFFSEKGRLYRDASIGITFTGFFSLGIILISNFASSVDLDLDCILFGEIIMIPFNSMYISGVNYGPLAFWTLGSTLLILSIFIFLFFKELHITGFDPDYSRSIGINPSKWNYYLMLLLSIVTVVAFEAVGSVLVVAFLVIPPATAYLLTGNMKTMLFLSICFALFSTFGGFFIADKLNNQISASMAVFSGVIFLSTFLFQQFFYKKQKNEHTINT